MKDLISSQKFQMLLLVVLPAVVLAALGKVAVDHMLMLMGGLSAVLMGSHAYVDANKPVEPPSKE